MIARTQIRLLSSVAIVLSFGASAYAANFPGTPATPTIYQVTLKKVELCTGSDGAGSCTGALIVGGSTSKAFDIASAGVGATIGSYANLSNLPIGSTFTHVRATVDSAIVISAIGTDTANGGPAPCSTLASGGGSVSAATSASFPAGVPQSSTVYVPHVGSYTIAGVTTTLAESDFQTVGARGYIKRPNDADVVITYQLVSPFKPVRNQTPRVTVKFDVRNSVGFMWSGVCQVFPEPPVVTIDIQ